MLTTLITNFKKQAFIVMQYCLPQQLLSALLGKLANIEISWLKNAAIKWFIKSYKVDLSEAIYTDYRQYKSFNDFFTRRLQNASRILDNSAILVSPVDGTISQNSEIDGGSLIQAKGKLFTVSALLGEASNAKHFDKGSFSTIYLAPYNYHRIHAPLSASLTSITYIPGKLFSVNPTTAENINNLFALNERVVCNFDSELGKISLVMVGAMIVGSIYTKWTGYAGTKYKGKYRHIELDTPQSVALGEDIGHFALGSTVILLSQKPLEWKHTRNDTLLMGEKIAR